MNEISKTPSYNLKVVIQETGLKPDTLRAWERRYGLPAPTRSDGGHRLYSEYDIEMIKWLIARQEEGLRINRAVQLWLNLEEQGQDPLQSVQYAETAQRLAQREVLSGVTLDEIRERWIDACLAFDEIQAENIMAQAFARYPMETVCLEVLVKGISEVGELWYTGGSTVQQEHFASALAIRRLNALLAAAPPPSRRGKILTTCPPGEDHILTLLMITLFLRLRGWQVVYLGANVPITKMDTAISSSKPDLIVATAQQLYTAANLFAVANFVHAQGVPLAYGGLIFTLIPELRKKIRGYFLGESLDNITQSIEYFLAQKPVIAEIEPVRDEFKAAAAHFSEYQPMISAYMWEKFQGNGMKDYHLEIANEFLSKDIQAGLRLGDLGFLKFEIDWLAGLLQTNNIPGELLPKYLSLYKEAVEKNLDQRGQLIVDWLDSVVLEEQV